MSDDVKAANEALVESMVRQLRDCASVGDEMTLDDACLLDDAADWIAGEPARIAAAREEQARADVEAANNALARGESWTPSLTATPRVDEIAALRARVAELEAGLHALESINAALARERDEARERADEAVAEAARLRSLHAPPSAPRAKEAIERLTAECDEAVAALRECVEELTCYAFDENGGSHRCVPCDRDIDRNGEIRAHTRAVLAKHPEGGR